MDRVPASVIDVARALQNAGGMRAHWIAIVVAASLAAGCKDKSSSGTVDPEATPAAGAFAAGTTVDPAAALAAGAPAGASTLDTDIEMPSAAIAAAPPAAGAQVDVGAIAAAEAEDLPVESFGGVSTARGFRVSYMTSTATGHEDLQTSLEQARVFETLTEALNGLVRVPTKIDVQVGGCGTVNAFYDPKRQRIIVCYELMQYFAALFSDAAEKAGSTVTPEQLGAAVMGATEFAFFHEVGHGLIDILDLAAVGREEDAVDQLATLILIGGGDQGVGMAMAGAYWFKIQHDAGQDRTPFSDEHAFDGQRYYNILCLIYGSDPEAYADLASSGALPEDRAKRCPAEFTKIASAWESLLAPHLANRAAARVAYTPAIDPTETEDGADDIAALTAGGAGTTLPPMPPDMQAKYDKMTPDQKRRVDELRAEAQRKADQGKVRGCEMVKTMLAKNASCADQSAAVAKLDCSAKGSFAEATRHNTACVEVLRAKGEEYKAAARPNSCEKVAAHARGLLFSEMLDQAKTMSAGKSGNLRARVKAELPAFQEALLAECAQQAWSDDVRACVLGAKTLADARASCNM